MPTTPAPPTPEAAVLALGRAMLQATEGQTASVFQRGYWNDRLMDWSMRRPDFKVELFRFVDVLPVLATPDEVARHVQEYFARPSQGLPAPFRWGLKTLAPRSPLAGVAARQIERNVVGMAHNFIAGRDGNDALGVLERMWTHDGVAFTVDVLGESTVSEAEALLYQTRYVDLIEQLAAHARRWPARPALEHGAFGPVPRVNVSVKVSALDAWIKPEAPEAAIARLAERLDPILRCAAREGVFINLDMEHYGLKALTLELFRHLMERPAYADLQAGCVIQAYLRDSAQDLDALIGWARERGRVVTVRLVKGAYWDHETIIAEQHGWPVPVYCSKEATDANYERLSRTLLENADIVRPAFASHNVRSLAYAIATARHLGLPDDAYEVQMLYGMAEPLKVAVRAQGVRLRDYVPVGELIPGMAYLVRRLLENTSNESWLRARFADNASPDTLLRAPRPRSPLAPDPVTPTGYPAAGIPGSAMHGTGPFEGEALTDFSLASARTAMLRSLQRVRERAGGVCPLVIDGQPRETRDKLFSRNPADPTHCVAAASCATAADADDAIQAALRAFPAWRDTPPRARALVLVRAAQVLRERRFELSALMVFEAGKSWVEADADVAEAIDFMEYYARELVALAQPRRMGDKPGEVNHLIYEPRGLCAIIAPWNFPLAILTGMASAALVTGNCALLKPAEQTPAIAYALMSALHAAGLPPGVCHLLPGRGEEVGAYLVEHPKVDLIAFTGSRPVGLGIVRAAAEVRPGQRNIKRVIAELGGKNAIVVDSDADMDEAIAGVVRSAFGFQGQKCSACSRVIVLHHHYDAFVERLVAATRALKVGPPEDPAWDLGPVIDADAKARIEQAIARGERDARLVHRGETPAGARGHYVAPHIFADVRPDVPLAQEEIFGPVLAVLRADSFEQALDWTMATPYALTAGIYSRSPTHIQRAREALRVGNLYINRGITGALVGRQPFGGTGMSGIGSKAGGPDYLPQFMTARTVTENTVRRGFAPE